ncbi:MAG: polysaccharide deacetylase family protein [Planctomycetes bacterium]|nr:polysaccharide deacetylase family protein [Planctomycetota bacterium]
MTGPFPGGRRAAVSLTYDDCLACHRLAVAPALSARDMLGTFYCTANAGDLHDNVESWRAVAESGHEIGNHTCFHPCRRQEGRDWPDRAYDLNTYSRKRIVDEVHLADRVLRLVDGCERRSYAATCGQTSVGPLGAEESFVDDLRRFATVVRSGRGGIQPLRRPDFVLGSHGADGKDAATTIAAIEPLLDAGGWLLITMHGVGKGTHGLFVDEAEHTAILDWIAERSDRIWAGTVSGVAERLAALPA